MENEQIISALRSASDTVEYRKALLKTMGFKQETKFELVSVTPDMAEALFANGYNKNVRKLVEKRVDAYAEEMRRGNWKVDNTELIRFNKEGFLIDGQHRMKAVIKSDTTQQFWAAYDCADEEFIDIGSRRSDMIYYQKDAEWINKDIKAIAKTKITLDNGILAFGQSASNINLTRSIIKDDMLANKELYEKANAVANKVKKALKGHFDNIKPSVIGGIYAHLIYNGASEEFVEGFFDFLSDWRGNRKADKMLQGIRNAAFERRSYMEEWRKAWMRYQGYKDEQINATRGFKIKRLAAVRQIA